MTLTKLINAAVKNDIDSMKRINQKLILSDSLNQDRFTESEIPLKLDTIINNHFSTDGIFDNKNKTLGILLVCLCQNKQFAFADYLLDAGVNKLKEGVAVKKIPDNEFHFAMQSLLTYAICGTFKSNDQKAIAGYFPQYLSHISHLIHLPVISDKLVHAACENNQYNLLVEWLNSTADQDSFEKWFKRVLKEKLPDVNNSLSKFRAHPDPSPILLAVLKTDCGEPLFNQLKDDDNVNVDKTTFDQVQSMMKILQDDDDDDNYDYGTEYPIPSVHQHYPDDRDWLSEDPENLAFFNQSMLSKSYSFFGHHPDKTQDQPLSDYVSGLSNSV